ncbi:hypothetical protein [Streptomyces sp. NPDC097619]|uniref:hypothetical protein n=1 Tax=Streptomyces sp. NPDC097619 TaxID=3157228 RepID=UPI003317A8F9
MSTPTIAPGRPEPVTWPASQTGPCARCHQPTCRYGAGGSPLCRRCKELRDEALKK